MPYRGDDDAYICETCGEEHHEDSWGRAGCLVLRDEREETPTVRCWCDEVCLSKWLDSPAAKGLFPSM